MKRPGIFESDSEQSEPHKRRKRGEGRLWKIGRIYWIQYYVHSRQVRESTHSEKKDVAERLLARRLAEIEADTFVGSSARRLRYEQMRDALYDDYETNQRKWLRIGKKGRYICGVHHLDAFFTAQRGLSISTGRIREFIVARQLGGATNGTINRELALLRRMFNLALEEGTLRSIPHFPMLREASPRKGFLEFAEFQAPPRIARVPALGGYNGVLHGDAPR